MATYFKENGTPISADMTWYSSDVLSTKEMDELEGMDARAILAYADVVPSWDYVEEGMWDYIAYWCDLDQADFYDDQDNFDFERFMDAANAVLDAKEEG